jgi:hypothetical protein
VADKDDTKITGGNSRLAYKTKGKKVNWKDKHIKFSELPKDIYVNFDWKETECNEIDFSKCRYLIIWHHQNKEKDFNNLPEIDGLEYLEINWSSSKSLIGLEKYKKLKRLELHYCTKIESLKGIDKLHSGIEYLHINQSKKLKGHTDILKLKNLTTLCFNDCGEIDSINFIKKLDNLVDFRFVNTNVLNGQLSPLIEHPKLINAGFLNKRHYSHKQKEIDKILKNKKV